MRIHIKHDEIVLLMLDYLKRHDCIESMRSLERESKVALDRYGRELDFLRSLFLDGQWSDAENFISPLKNRSNFDYDKVLFEIRKQKFLELLDEQALTPAVVELVEHLKALENKCSKSEFNSLCYLLTLKSLNDHPDYRFWTPLKGRMQCFEHIREEFSSIYPDEWIKRQKLNQLQPNRLVETLKHSILYQLSVATSQDPNLKLESKASFTLLHDLYPKTLEQIHSKHEETAASPLSTPPEVGRAASASPEPSPNRGSVHRTSLSWTLRDEPKLEFSRIGIVEDPLPIRSITFSPYGDRIAVGSNSRCVRICASDEGPSVHPPSQQDGFVPPSLPLLHVYENHHRGSVYCLDWHKDGALIVSGSNDKMVKLSRVSLQCWEDAANDYPRESIASARPGQEVVRRWFHTGTVRDVAFRSFTTEVAAVGAGDNAVRIWSYETASDTPLMALRGHVAPVFAMRISRDGDLLFSASADHCVKVWDLRSRECAHTLHEFDLPISSLALDLQARSVYAGYSDGACMAWDLTGGKMLWSMRTHEADCRSLDLSPDDQLLLSGSFDGSVSILDARYGDRLEHYANAHQNKVVEVQWHPTKAQFASCSSDCSAVLWSAQSTDR